MRNKSIFEQVRYKSSIEVIKNNLCVTIYIPDSKRKLAYILDEETLNNFDIFLDIEDYVTKYNDYQNNDNVDFLDFNMGLTLTQCKNIIDLEILKNSRTFTDYVIEHCKVMRGHILTFDKDTEDYDLGEYYIEDGGRFVKRLSSY